MANLFAAIDQAYAGHENKTAVVVDGTPMSYQELKQKVTNISEHLAQAGVKPNQLVASILPNGIDFILLLLALSRLNATIVPLSLGVTNKAFVKAKQQLNFSHVVCWHALLKEKQQLCNDQELYWVSAGKELAELPYFTNWSQTKEVSSDIAHPELDSAFILTMTSGSTGAPKPIALSQKTKILRAEAAIKLYSVTQQDKTLIATPLYHSLAQRLLFVSLLTGGTAVVMSKFSIAGWLETIEREQISFTIAVSSQLKQMNNELANTEKDLTSLRCLVSSSALLDHETKVQLLSKLNCEFHECYGASEVAIATNIKFDINDNNGSVGTAIEGTELIILDDENNSVIGQTGEIACKTPMQFSGYYQQDELTRSSYFDGYFKTGDLGKLDEQGLLYFLGRKKEIIISGGINVYPNDIESLIKPMSVVDDCVAFALTDDNLGEVVALALIATPEQDLARLVRDIRMKCAMELDHHQQPRKFFFFSKFPQNAMSKIDKLSIREVSERIVHNDNKNSPASASLYFQCEIE